MVNDNTFNSFLTNSETSENKQLFDYNSLVSRLVILLLFIIGLVILLVIKLK